MYRMPGKQTTAIWTALEVLLLSVCKSPTLSLTFHQTQISWPFFYYFSICFVSFHIIFVQAVFFHVNLGFREKKKTLRKRVYNHGDSCLLRFTHTYANYPFHLADFAGDKNVAFHYPDVCLFVHPFYFDNQDFISFKLQTSFQRFNARKVMRNAVTDYKSRNTL